MSFLSLMHQRAEAYPEDLASTLNTVLAVRAERVQERAPDADRLRAERDRLEHVRRAPHAAVDVDLELGVREVPAQPERGHDLDEDLDAGARGVELAAAVVGEDDAGEAGVVGHERVLPALDAFEDEGHWRGG